MRGGGLADPLLETCRTEAPLRVPPPPPFTVSTFIDCNGAQKFLTETGCSFCMEVLAISRQLPTRGSGRYLSWQRREMIYLFSTLWSTKPLIRLSLHGDRRSALVAPLRTLTSRTALRSPGTPLYIQYRILNNSLPFSTLQSTCLDCLALLKIPAHTLLGTTSGGVHSAR
jgi:hypothetical protein